MMTEQNIENTKIYNVLRNSPLFQGVEDAQLSIILPLIKEYHFNERDILLKEGDNPDNFYIIQSGKVEISKKSIKNNKSYSVCIFGPSASIGEIGFYFYKSRTASIIALTNVVAVGCNMHELYSKLDDANKIIILRNIGKVVTDRLNYAYDEVMETVRSELEANRKIILYQSIFLFVIVCLIYGFVINIF